MPDHATPPGDGAPRSGRRRILALLSGPAAFSVVLLLPPPAGMSPEAARAAAITVWVALWWVTEALPIPATSLLPLVLLPATGTLSPAATAANYANPLIFVFIGGFMIALALERWQLHRRIALLIIARLGQSPARVVLGFMLATALLSMWISNTAATMLMIPMATAVIAYLGGGAAPDRSDAGAGPSGPLATALLLGIAYAASIGGIATLIGTPPNIVLAAAAQTLLDTEISFARWMLFATPPAAVALLAVWFYLTRVAFSLQKARLGGRPAGPVADPAGRGPLSPPQRAVLIIFVLVALAWMTRPLLINPYLPLVDDGVIALCGALALFAVPASLAEGRFLLDWETAVRLPWGIVLLFGGGLAIATAFSETGLSVWIGQSLGVLGQLPPLLIVALLVAAVVFLTEITSNTATATMLMPVLAGMAPAIGVHPLLLMAPAAIAASCAFMLPVATPPNTIVFGTGYVTMAQMVRAGLWLNLGSILLVGIVTYWLLPLLGVPR